MPFATAAAAAASTIRSRRVLPEEAAGQDMRMKPPQNMSRREREKLLRALEKEMKEAARRLEFEEAAQLRDAIMEIRAEARG